MTTDDATGWHREVIPKATDAALHALHGAHVLDSLYLAGGTALALHAGHRLSNDLDFFALDLFDEEILLQRLQAISGFSLVARAPHTLHTTVCETKVSFLGYEYPVLYPCARFGEIAVADVRDIACMKISAIASRGTKRDFVDLYIAAKQFGLGSLLQLFGRKYARTDYNRLHLLKSLAFFDDAEKDPMPHMLVTLDWNEVKEFFTGEVSRLV